MLKISQIATLLISFSCLFASNFPRPVLAELPANNSKKNPCLKSNNGIGNNHNIYLQLPINSLTLNDPLNQIISIRIDPGNPGQMALFEDQLKEQGFQSEPKIQFVMSQIWDAEIKVKQNNLQCSGNDLIDKDYTINLFAD